GTIGDLDSYQLPDAKGYSSLLRYVSGVSEEDRQARREEILSTRSSDFKEFADVVDAVKDNGVAVVVASEEAGSSYVISKYICNTWLWDNIRVSGGAFGGICDFDTRSGVLSFLSYRDPNLLKTLAVYNGTSDFLRQLEVDDKTLNKAIIGTIGDLDSYQLPDAKVDAVKDNGVAVVVASEEAVDAANKECSNLFQVKKAI
nr:presequence protease 1, chloroplastic/mitochondrial-like [Tanacetum cinerariifolium]